MIKNPPRQGRVFTALLRRAASAAFDAGSPCVGRLESIKSKGAPAKSAILWGTPLRHGGSPPGRLCTGKVKISKNRPERGGFLLGKQNRGIQSLSRLRRQLPLHKGALRGRFHPALLGVQGEHFFFRSSTNPRTPWRVLSWTAPAARSLFGGEAATAHLGRAASAASDAGSPCVGRPESMK